jgi:hypothetical protein
VGIIAIPVSLPSQIVSLAAHLVLGSGTKVDGSAFNDFVSRPNPQAQLMVNDEVRLPFVSCFLGLGTDEGPTTKDAHHTFCRLQKLLPVINRLNDIAERSGRWNNPKLYPSSLTARDFAGIVSMITLIGANDTRSTLAQLAMQSEGCEAPDVGIMLEMDSREAAIYHVAASAARLADPITVVTTCDSVVLAELFNAEDADGPVEEGLRMPSPTTVIIPSRAMSLGKSKETNSLVALCYVVIADEQTLKPLTMLMGIKSGDLPGIILTDMTYRLKPAAQLLAWGKWDHTDATIDLEAKMDRKQWRAGLTKMAKTTDWLTYRTLNVEKTTRSSIPVGDGEKRSVKAHFRRGHWHRYRVGPRDDWTYERIFIRPVIVGGTIENIQRPVYK